MLKTQFLVLENTDAPTQLTLVDFRYKPSLLRPITALPWNHVSLMEGYN